MLCVQGELKPSRKIPPKRDVLRLQWKRIFLQLVYPYKLLDVTNIVDASARVFQEPFCKVKSAKV